MRHPEHEKEFLPYLKSKLESREEQQLYSYIEACYKELREELLGLISSSEEDEEEEEKGKAERKEKNDDCEGVCMK